MHRNYRRGRAPRLAAVTVLALAAALTLTTGSATATTATSTDAELRPYAPADGGPNIPAPKSNAPSRVPATNVPRVTGLAVVAGPAAKVAEGLSLKDQRRSNQGNSFSLEPPDQALCAGNGYVLEGVNNVFAITTTAGGPLSAPQSYVPFWNNGVPEFDRIAGRVGPFVSDPRCYFDPGTRRFFMTELQLGTDPDTGNFTGDSFVNIAVSRSAVPTTSSADWRLYRLNVRNDGTQGTPAHRGCPCLGDQPLIGADQNGFFVTTNEFPLAGPGFNGNQSYAFDKVALTRGVLTVQRIETVDPPLAEGVAYSIQPATSPSTSDWSPAAGGTEFALSALDFTGGLDNRIATWAFTNTKSLAGRTPNVHLDKVVIASEVYGMPPSAAQKTGPTPLADAVNAKENLLSSNDDRMNQTVFAGGRLFSAVNTAVKTETNPTSVGIGYFVVAPSIPSGGALSATVANQGYVSVTNQSVMYPSIGVTAGAGTAAMTFSLSGPDYYPSSAYVRLDGSGTITSPVTVSAAGTRPADGFTGYPAYGGGGIERWGDYSTAVADGSSIWMASEYVPGTFVFSPYLANWGTSISRVD